MKKIKYVIFLSAVLYSCGSQNVTQTLSETTEDKAQRLLSELRASGEIIDNISLLSGDLSEEFVLNKGFRQPNIGTASLNTGKVVFKDGLEISVLNSNITAQLLPCEPFVQAKSYVGYAGAKSKITLPNSVNGLNNSGETAYTYIGLYTSETPRQGGRTEAGFFMPSLRATYSTNVWYAYIRAALPNGSFYYIDFRNEISNTNEGILRGTNVSVSQKVLKTAENGVDVYKLSTIFQILNSSRTSVVASLANVYPTTGSYFSSSGRTNLAGGKTTSYLSDNTASGDGILDARWYDFSLINANLTEGNPRLPYSYTESLLTPSRTSYYTSDDVQGCLQRGEFQKNVIVYNSNYETNESIYVP